MKPFFYAVSDNEGNAVFDEICIARSPEELADSFVNQIEDCEVKIVPVYTGPQIEAMREKIEELQKEIAKLKARNNVKHMQKIATDAGFQYWRSSDAHGVTATKEEAENFIADLIGVEVEIKTGQELKARKVVLPKYNGKMHQAERDDGYDAAIEHCADAIKLAGIEVAES